MFSAGIFHHIRPLPDVKKTKEKNALTFYFSLNLREKSDILIFCQ